MPRVAKKSFSSRRVVIPVRALDFVMSNTKDMRRTRIADPAGNRFCLHSRKDG